MSTETILKRISTKDKEAFMKMVEESYKVVNDKPAEDSLYEKVKGIKHICIPLKKSN